MQIKVFPNLKVKRVFNLTAHDADKFYFKFLLYSCLPSSRRKKLTRENIVRTKKKEEKQNRMWFYNFRLKLFLLNLFLR